MRHTDDVSCAGRVIAMTSAVYTQKSTLRASPSTCKYFTWSQAFFRADQKVTVTSFHTAICRSVRSLRHDSDGFPKEACTGSGPAPRSLDLLGRIPCGRGSWRSVPSLQRRAGADREDVVVEPTSVRVARVAESKAWLPRGRMDIEGAT
jgi:hypothetical protein